MLPEEQARHPGRPLVISKAVVPGILAAHRGEMGCRAITRELSKQGVLVNWGTVRRITKTDAAWPLYPGNREL